MIKTYHENLVEAFRLLKEDCGGHGAAASFIGLSRDHYCAIRNGRVHIPRRTAELIILKAREAQALAGRLPQELETVSV